MNYLTYLHDTRAAVGGRDTNADYKWAATFVLLVVLEGSFGKWIADSLEYPPVILRDVLGLFIIYRAAVSGRLGQHRNLFGALSAWTLLVAVFAFVQALLLQQSLILVAIGLRFWLLYFWVALALCSTLTWAELQRLTRLLTVLFWLMLPLLVAQNHAGVDAWINKSATDGGFIFRISEDVVRTTGTFSFTSGFTCFLSLLTPLLLTGNETSDGEPIRWYQSSLGAFMGLILAATVSGSRGVMVSTALMIGISLVLSLAVGARGALAGLVGASVGLAFAMAMPVLLPDTVSAIETRITSAAEDEDTSLRAIHTIIGSPDAWAAFSVLGEGLGMGANMAVKLAGVAPAGTFVLAEVETERVLLAGGLIGAIWLGIKVLLSAMGIWAGLRVSALNRSLRPTMIWLCCAASLITWPITGQLAAQSLSCLALALAAASIGIFDRSRP